MVRAERSSTHRPTVSRERREEKYTSYRVGSSTDESDTMEPTSGGGLVCGLAENEGAGVRTGARHAIGGSSSCAEAASAASRHRLVSMLATAVL